MELTSHPGPDLSGAQKAAATDQVLRIGVVGQGFMGRAHSFAWSQAAKLGASPLQPRLSVLCGQDGAALARNASLFGFAASTRSWQELVESEEVDLVDVCTPGASHAEISLAALRSGKHVLCEKPLANTVAEARRLAGAAAEAAATGRFAMVGFNYRRVPALALASQLVAEGRIGQLRQVRAAYLQDWLVDPESSFSWRLDRSLAGSGALSDLGAHVVDLLRFITGDEIVEVVASLETFARQRPVPGASGPAARREVTVDDACVALGRLAGGALVTLEATRVAAGRKNVLRIELSGTRGSLAFDLERLNELELSERGNGSRGGFERLLVTEPGDPYLSFWWPPGHMLGWDHSFVHECADLVAAIAEGRQPVPSFADGLRVQLVLDAIERAANEHRWVAVDDVAG